MPKTPTYRVHSKILAYNPGMKLRRDMREIKAQMDAYLLQLPEFQLLKTKMNELAGFQDLPCQWPGCINKVPWMRGPQPRYCLECKPKARKQAELERQRKWRKDNPERYEHQKMVYNKRRILQSGSRHPGDDYMLVDYPVDQEP